MTRFRQKVGASILEAQLLDYFLPETFANFLGSVTWENGLVAVRGFDLEVAATAA